MKSMDQEAKEGLELAIQSIDSAFNTQPNTSTATLIKSTVKPIDLLPLLSLYLKTQAQLAPKLSPKDKDRAEQLKAEGNKALGAKEFTAAIESYSQAIKLDPQNPIYLANRAAAYSQAGEHLLASQDAKLALKVDPSYSKSYSRLGHAEFCLSNYAEAVEAYTTGLEHDPTNERLKSSLKTAQSKLQEYSLTTTPSSSQETPSANLPDFSSMMKDPSFMSMAQSMMSNPAISGLMSNPAFAGMMKGGGEGGGMDFGKMMADPGVAAMAQGLMKDPAALSGLMANPQVAEMAKKYSGPPK